MRARKSISPVAAILIVAFAVVVAVVLFWKAAKGTPKHAPGVGGPGMGATQQQGHDAQGRVGRGRGRMRGG